MSSKADEVREKQLSEQSTRPVFDILLLLFDDLSSASEAGPDRGRNVMVAKGDWFIVFFKVLCLQFAIA